MIALLDSRKVDVAAVAHALDGLRARGATCQAYLQAGGHDVCVNAVNGGGHGWREYSEAASRRAATRGRRLLPVLDSGEVDGRYWIAYDMGSTTSLPKYRGLHPLPTATCIRVLSDVARALDDAARDGVFPTELPPESVFVSRRGARLGDLGTTREAFDRAAFELEGDPAFVPPEVLHGERAGERSGVYLFGALLYHLITGATPRPGPSMPLGGARPDLPVSIKSIIATVMADDPGSRPASAGEAHDMARRALRGEPPARTGGVRRRARTPKQGVGLNRATAKPNGAAPKLDATAPKPNGAAPKHTPAAGPGPKPKATATALKPTPKSKAPAPKPESAVKSAAAKSAVPSPASPEAARPKSAKAPEPRSWQGPSRSGRKPAVAKPAAAQPAASKQTAPKQDTRRPAAGKASAEAPARARPAPRKPSARAVAVGSALLLGAAAGLLLGSSPDPEPARAQSVTAGSLSVTLPPGWHPGDRGGERLSARADSGVSLHARLVDRPLDLQEEYTAVRLGEFQVWRHAARGAAVYTTSTSKGTLVVTCRASASNGSAPLRECERAASTLGLRGARALPLAAALEDSERLRAAVAALGAERDRARTRLDRASTPRGQRLHAKDLARIHERAATALDGLAEADSIKTAARRAADAYSSLATSAKSGSARRWDRMSQRVRRSEAVLAKAIATAG